MKKVFLFVLLGSLPSVCCPAASREGLKEFEGVVLQKQREILGACIFYIRGRNTVESTGSKWSPGEIKMISEIDLTTRTLAMRKPGYTPGPNSTYTFKYLDDSQLKGLEDTLRSLGRSFYDKSRPAFWYDLCKNAGVPEEQRTIPGAMAFLESCEK